MGTPANVHRTRTGKVRAVCQFCGRMSKAVEPSKTGEVGLANLTAGWSTAPYPATSVHADGSTGSTYRCPGVHGPLPWTPKRDR